MCGEASVTQQYAQVRWDSFAVEVLDSLYSTAPVSMHCNQSDARPFPVSPSQTSSSQLGRKHLKKRIYMFLFFFIRMLLAGRLGQAAAARGHLHPGQAALPL